jgi:hypothetical protein
MFGVFPLGLVSRAFSMHVIDRNEMPALDFGIIGIAKMDMVFYGFVASA